MCCATHLPCYHDKIPWQTQLQGQRVSFSSHLKVLNRGEKSWQLELGAAAQFTFKAHTLRWVFPLQLITIIFHRCAQNVT